MDVKNILKNKRIEKQLTLDEVGRLVGVSAATISRWESGDIANMKRDKIAKLAKALDISPAIIMGWNETDLPNIKNNNPDPDIRRIQRAREKMSEQEKNKMMKILEASFDDYFGDDFIDEDND